MAVPIHALGIYGHIPVGMVAAEVFLGQRTNPMARGFSSLTLFSLFHPSIKIISEIIKRAGIKQGDARGDGEAAGILTISLTPVANPGNVPLEASPRPC